MPLSDLMVTRLHMFVMPRGCVVDSSLIASQSTSSAPKSKSHQPSGLRWFRFKTPPIFQLGGFTLPPTPFPGLWFEAVAGWNRIFFRCSFRAPFFSPLGTPQNRYHKLFRLQSDPILRFKTGPKQAPTSALAFSLFFLGFLIFSIPPQVPPV